MTTTIPFNEFPKIPRLRRDITITEKIDGTNASILVPENGGPVLAGSRTRWVTPESDSYGFARWVKANEDALREGLGFGHHFGEWWGAGIQRRYGITDKRFSLFNTFRWNGGMHPLLAQLGVSTVPVLFQGSWSKEAINAALEKLRSGGSVAAPGFDRPEGIVVFHAASRNLYKVTLEKDSEPKGKSESIAAGSAA